MSSMVWVTGREVDDVQVVAFAGAVDRGVAVAGLDQRDDRV
jgi:hypothetical protein